MSKIETVICKHCSKEFKGYPSARRKYCSRSCSATEFLTGNTERAEQVRQYNLGRKLSLETRLKISKSMSGENGSNWQGGLVQLKKKVRRNLLYKLWEQEVFARDLFKCQKCNRNHHEVRLEAHHEKPISQILKENKITTIEQAVACEELFDVSNGITYCSECHKETDSWFYKALTRQVSPSN